MKKKPVCIQCRWCGVRVDFDSGSNYCCQRAASALTDAILHKKGCKDFAPEPTAKSASPRLLGEGLEARRKTRKK